MSFEPFTRVTGVAAPLPRANIDTDVIIRIDRLTSREPEDLARYAFEALRYLADGTEDPSFVLNQAPYRGAPILIAGANFGCGSSREPAVWALRGLGIRCVIAPSFGDILASNCFQCGLLPIALSQEDVGAIAVVAARGESITVDLVEERIVSGHDFWPFAISPPQRRSLLEGLDDLELTLKESPRIAAWEENDRRARPWAWNIEEVGR